MADEESPERARGGEGRWTKERPTDAERSALDAGGGSALDNRRKGLKDALPLEEGGRRNWNHYENRPAHFSKFSRANSGFRTGHGPVQSTSANSAPPESVPRSPYFFEHDDRSANGARGRYNSRYSGRHGRGGFPPSRFPRRHSYPPGTGIPYGNNPPASEGYDFDPDDRWVPTETESPLLPKPPSAEPSDQQKQTEPMKLDDPPPPKTNLPSSKQLKPSPYTSASVSEVSPENQEAKQKRPPPESKDKQEQDKAEVELSPEKRLRDSNSQRRRPLDSDGRRTPSHYHDSGRSSDDNKSDFYKGRKRYHPYYEPPSRDPHGRRYAPVHRHEDKTSGHEKPTIKWGHDMFESANRSPSPLRDETLEKIEALLSS